MPRPQAKVPMRRVVRTDFHQGSYSRYGHGSNILKLECGHEVVRKGSVTVPQWVRCNVCRYMGISNPFDT